MSDCDALQGCPFFNEMMADKEGMTAIYKRRYCRGDFMQCARHMVKDALGKDRVPIDLYPNMQERARKIIEDSQKHPSL